MVMATSDKIQLKHILMTKRDQCNWWQHVYKYLLLFQNCSLEAQACSKIAIIHGFLFWSSIFSWLPNLLFLFLVMPLTRYGSLQKSHFFAWDGGNGLCKSFQKSSQSCTYFKSDLYWPDKQYIKVYLPCKSDCQPTFLKN